MRANETLQRPWRTRSELVAGVFGFALLVGCLSLVFSFGCRLRDTAGSDHLPDTAVVFTGQFDRIEEAIDLLAEGRIRRIFISGVNSGAGLSTQTFARQFGLSQTLKEGLGSGIITLATGAQDTIENAIETSCWLNRNARSQKVLLITSNIHMPRASLLLEQASGQVVERLSTSSSRIEADDLHSREFGRFAASWIMAFLPARLWPAQSGFSCIQS